MNAVIFARGYNITGQVEQCREYAEKRGYNVEGVIVGQGRELPDIIAGLGVKIDLVIVRDMSRISRNALENYTILSQLEIDYGVLVKDAVERPHDEAVEKLMRNIIAGLHEEQQKERARQEKIFELKLRGVIE
jgi:DNA invertase Pin-like site-specific DNA recombinase